jgi:flagellar basal-body rod protein FlgG
LPSGSRPDSPAQRSFEMNSKVIQAVDEMAGTISKGIR